MQNIEITLTKNKKPFPDYKTIGFGTHFTDHMFIMDYDKENGWHSPRIVPYDKLEFEPSCSVFHYGQALFEGMKAYRTPDDRILLFRPQENFKRLNMSAERICIPPLDEEFLLKALITLVNIDRDWVPSEPGMTLYIRPFIISTDISLGVHPASHFKFMIIMTPVTSYYTGGLTPQKILVESKYVRAVKGGTGNTKVIGNYAASLKSQKTALDNGYSQVLWLDGIEHKYVEEVGSMNIFFKIGDKLVTPELNGSILPGITRDSVIKLAKNMGIEVEERLISIDEIFDAAASGELKEVFGSGTAVVISPVGELKYGNKEIIINAGKIGPLSQKMYDVLTGIQFGKIKDTMGWTVEVK